jgi:hypothetical protein
MKKRGAWAKGDAFIYVCAPRLPKPKMSVSLRDHGVMILGMAWHGPSGKLMRRWAVRKKKER